MESDGGQSFIAATQHFSDKPYASFRADELSFQTLHITALKYLEKNRPEQIIEKKQSVGGIEYLHVRLHEATYKSF